MGPSFSGLSGVTALGVAVDKNKPAARTTKVVWRISESSPMGEWVELRPARSAPPRTTSPLGDLPEVSFGGWVMSSFDLLNGTDINENPDTVPGELYDELFAPQEDAFKTPPEK
jgi:hypothetical protein